MFLNLSNHPSPQWPEAEIAAAKALGGDLMDMTFPEVPPEAGPEEVRHMGSGLIQKIAALRPDAILIQGEFTLAFFLVSALQASGFACYAATTRRISQMELLPDGSKRRISVFAFVQFRRYCEPALNIPTLNSDS